MGRVLSLHVGDRPGLPKTRTEELQLIAGYGVAGDRHAGGDPGRAVLVAGVGSYRHALGAGIELPYGALGENLLLDLDPHAWVGWRLEVGEALLELVAVCTVCAALTRLDPRLPRLLYQGRGVYARVLRGGVVRLADVAQILPPTAEEYDAQAIGEGSR
ncbi:MOSC domain-containing protein [Calidithermus timidus]|jgi:MOSC domain-containing protein YiiM|uniref:MOSC domain-containing protein n=1 Tax=Calidithermus timidus TaxID=307124 RepID=UPI000377C99D|nr:MOSC domain-containing protein [Calidithermus timidus]